MSSRFCFVFRGNLLILALLAGVTSSGWAQRTDYSKGQPLLPNPVAPYQARNVAPPKFTNSPRIDQLIKDASSPEAATWFAHAISTAHCR